MLFICNRGRPTPPPTPPFPSGKSGIRRVKREAVAGGKFELRPPVKSSDLDEKVLTTTPVRDTPWNLG